MDTPEAGEIPPDVRSVLRLQRARGAPRDQGGSMRLEGLAVLVCALATACVPVRAPPIRVPTPGEQVVLDAAAFDAPTDAGWQIHDVAGPGNRVVTLTHTAPDGTVDRRAWVTEDIRSPEPMTPEAFLDAVRRVAKADEEMVELPGAEEAIALDDRLGPLSVSGRMRLEPRPGREATRAAAIGSLREFIPPSRPDRLYQAVWLAADGGTSAGADEGARRFMDSIRVGPPNVAPTLPDVGQSEGWDLALGPEVASLRGEPLVGGGLRLGRWGDHEWPRAGKGIVFGVDVRLFAGASDEWSALCGTLGLDIGQKRGRLVYGAGFEVGYGRLTESDTERTLPNLIVGPRAFARVHLLRDTRPVDLFLELNAGAATPSFFHGAALLGVRLADGRG
jgi:hypothetical protein